MSTLIFPDVKLVESLKYGSHPQGRFNNIARPPRIELSLSGCKDFNEDLLRFIVFHEIGHWYRWSSIALGDIFGSKPEEVFFIFGSPNSEEGFADAFASYFLERAEMRKRYPDQLQKLSGWLAGKEHQIAAFADRTLEALSAELGRKKPKPTRVPPPEPKTKNTGAKELSFAGHRFTAGGGKPTQIHRESIDLTTKEDHGSDPIGNGMFRMVPSGDIVNFEERERRLARFHRR